MKHKVCINIAKPGGTPIPGSKKWYGADSKASARLPLWTAGQCPCPVPR